MRFLSRGFSFPTEWVAFSFPSVTFKHSRLTQGLTSFPEDPGMEQSVCILPVLTDTKRASSLVI